LKYFANSGRDLSSFLPLAILNAAETGNHRAIRLLLEAQADPNPNIDWNPMSLVAVCATRGGSRRAVQYLLDAKAVMKKGDGDLMTQALFQVPVEDFHSSSKLIKSILYLDSSLIHARWPKNENSKTPLTHFCQNRRCSTSTVRYLLLCRADPNEQNYDGPLLREGRSWNSAYHIIRFAEREHKAMTLAPTPPKAVEQFKPFADVLDPIQRTKLLIEQRKKERLQQNQ